jgi:hypothetical protein
LCVATQAGCELPSADPVSGSTNNYLSDLTGESALATWTCTGGSCPWGTSLSNHVIAWPASAGPVATRLGYTASPAAYLPAGSANGLTLSIELGTAGVYAGEPQEPSHHHLATVSSGHSIQVAGLLAGEVLSVQSEDSFGYRVTMPPPANPPDAGTPATDPPDAGTPPGPGTTSQIATWKCTGAPCPWGDSLSGHALVWPTTAGAISTRLGYSVSVGIYLPAAAVNGADISIQIGQANAYAGLPGGASHRWLATIAAGQTFHVAGLLGGEVLSVQSDAQFTYKATLPPSDPGNDPGPAGEVIPSTQAFWRCNSAGCAGEAWHGAVIPWPAWAAHQDNGRAGNQSRSVFAADGTPLYPYMGAWAQGCEVTAESGTAVIIEWQRGTDAWRETWLAPRQSHTIALISPEDGAMIETYDGAPGFSVSLRNCTPQPIPQ